LHYNGGPLHAKSGTMAVMLWWQVMHDFFVAWMKFYGVLNVNV
jgi:hypothetical protein